MKKYGSVLVVALAILLPQTSLFGQAFTSLSYPGPQSYTAGTAISPLSPTVSGGPAAGGGQTTQAFAGSGLSGSLDGTGTGAYFSNPLNTAVDADGNIYVADAGNHKIRKISPAGVVTTLAGAGSPGYSDGTGTLAYFQHPSALAVDAAGNVFVSDQQNHRIRKITPAGVVTTFAGSGSIGSADGTGTAASFNLPIGLAFDAAGNLYVADYNNHKIRKITTAGVVTTFAGTGTAGLSNSTALSATFRNPMGIAFDASGNMYIADRLNHAIRKITTGGTVSTFAGTGSAGSSDGTGTGASFNQPNNLAVDASGNIYVADQTNATLRKITSGGVVTTFAGVAGSSSIVNGTGSVVRMTSTYGISIDKQGNLYVAQNSSNLIRKTVTTAFNVYPYLPAGLAFNTANGQISGTPVTGQSPRTYYFQAFNTTHSSAVATLSISIASLPPGITGSSNQNYITTYIPQNDTYTTDVAAMSASSSKDNVQTTIQYFDGLGRPSQTVVVKGSADGTADLVTPVEYDDLGRLKATYLPYAAATADGTFKTSAPSAAVTYYSGASTNRVQTTTPFSLSVYEPSPLNRIAEQGAPGASWQPVTGSSAGHTQKMDYSVNTTTDAVKRWAISGTTVSSPGNYAAGQLTKTTSKDENWKSADGLAGTVDEYKDMEGQVVCKRVWKDGSTGLSTYYVYDEYNRLRYVIPPKATATSFTENVTGQFNQLVYAYHYDAKGRLIEKKIPGKGWEEFCYDKLDRLTMSRDTLQKVAGKWLFTKYDGIGRVAYTGRISSTDTRVTHQTALDGATYVYCIRDNTNSTATGSGYTNTSLPNTVGAEVFTANYYDDYSFWNNASGSPTGSQTTAVKGLLTGTLVNTLPAGTSIVTTNFYDGKGQLVQSKNNHLMGGTDVTSIAYNFNGSIKNTVRAHSVTSTGTTTTITTRYKYDHMGRKLTTKMQIGTSGVSAGTETMISKLEYNSIGQLYRKYLHSTDSANYLQNTRYAYNERGWLKRQLSSEFSMKLDYDTAGSLQYNGNIGKQYYGHGSSSTFASTFTYGYDKLNRLTSGSSTGSVAMSEVLTYDDNGNILSLNRDGAGLGTYTYFSNSNRLKSITGTGPVTAVDYQYDANGNATTDGRTGISIAYNVLNLPSTITRTTPGLSMSYTYDGTGRKLRKTVTSPGSMTRTYVNGIEYNGSTIDFIQTDEGLARNSAGNYTFEYNLTDHLGNVRYGFQKNTGTFTVWEQQKLNYYPFGKTKFITTGTNKYLYNGKELQDEMNSSTAGQSGQMDYGARFYDPEVGRWNVIDLKAERYFPTSPYVYAINSPLKYIDPNGKEIEPMGTAEDILRINNALKIIEKTNPDIYRALKDAKEVFAISLTQMVEKVPVDMSTGSRSTMSFEQNPDREEHNGNFDTDMNIRNRLANASKERWKYSFTMEEPGTGPQPISEEDANDLVSLVNPRITLDNGLSGKAFGKVLAHEMGHAAYTLKNKAKSAVDVDDGKRGHSEGNPNGVAAKEAEKQFEEAYKEALKRLKEEEEKRKRGVN